MLSKVNAMAPEVYLNEEAFQEQHSLSLEEYSIVNNSVESAKTNFSGFDDSDSEQDESETSLIITHATSITVAEPHADPLLTSAEAVATPKRYKNAFDSNVSPDMFEDEIEASLEVKNTKNLTNKRIVCENSADLELCRNAQTSLSGVCPPPSVTIVQMSASEMLAKISVNSTYFWNANPSNSDRKSLLITESEAAADSDWPEILHSRSHGLHYNRNKLSEEFEQLCTKIAERHVGAETASSCTVFDNLSPCKKRLSKPRWGNKSPGRRLSHLARRRITFSNSNLQGASSASILGCRARQILVDAKRLSSLPKKSPKKSPNRSPFKRKRTPSSSAKKQLALRFRQMSGELENIAPASSSQAGSVKRTLFSSPVKTVEAMLAKRSLFPSPQSSLSPNAYDKKRKRSIDDEGACNPPKVAKRGQELSDAHRKKLQWAVYEALRHQNVTAAHPEFKVFASVLARVTRRLMPGAVEGVRTTERMFRVAKHHSFAVVKGRGVEEIVNECLRSTRTVRPVGYVAMSDVEEMGRKKEANKENVLQDKANIIESIEKRRELAGNKPRFANESRIDRIRKVISFDENGK